MKKLNGATIGFDDFDGTARVCAARRGAALFQAALTPRDAANAQFAAQLAAALADGTRCAAAAPPSATFSLPLERPPVAAAKFSRALPQLLDAHLPMPVADCAFAAVGYGGAVSLVAFAIRKADLEARIGALAASGANPARIVPLAHAVWSAASRDAAAARGTGARPGETARPLFVAIAGKNQALLAIGAGAAPETQIVCRANPEEIAARLKLAFHGGAQPPVCVAAGENHAAAAAAFAAFPGAKIITPESPEFYAAKALATDKPAGGGWFQDANLRSGALAHKSRAASAGRRFAAAMLSLGLFAALLFAASGARLAEAKRAAAASASTLQTALDDVAGYRVRTKGARAVDDAKRAAVARVEPELARHRQNRIPDALAQTTLFCAEKGITLKRLSLSGGGATASGDAPTPAAADELAKKLAALGLESQLAEPPKPDGAGMFQFMIAPLKK